MSSSQQTPDPDELRELINELGDEERAEFVSSLNGTGDLGWDPDMTPKERMRQKVGQFEEVSEGEFDANIHRPGTLLSDKIHYFAEHHDLIFPYDSKHLRAAGYNLRVGDSYSMNGETHDLGDDNRGVIEIPPFQVAVVKTHEVVNMPRFLIGRLSIKVGGAHKGLLWVGGPHVDPGYVGHLFCPIYNLSSETVRLSKGQGFGVIDFATTTVYKGDGNTEDDDGLQTYPRPPDGNLILEDYEGANLRSALWTEAGERLDEMGEELTEMENEVERLSTIFYSSIGGIFTVLAVLIAALSIFVSAGSGSSEAPAGLSPPELLGGLVLVAVVFGGLTVLYVKLLKMS